MGFDFSIIWAVIIFFGVMMYVVMDGFDLGIGILFPFIEESGDRDIMMNTVAPVWDGNETWLVLGGAGLFAAFPLAYSVILSALYLPLIFMLLGLIFRGVAFEFRFKALDHERYLWDRAFIGGSVAAAFFQGVALGAYVNGIHLTGHTFTGGSLDWLAPFPLFTGIGVVGAYALLGSTWLLMKTEGALQYKMIRLTKPLAWVLLFFICCISVWTPLSQSAIADRWFQWPGILWFIPVPFFVCLLFFILIKSLGGAPEVSPFLCSLGIIFLGYSGLAISLWPNIIPPNVNFWEASSPPQSQGFILVGALFIIPLILVYTGWSYYVFRGKVGHDANYH
jgi:cytochrome d ubiquinol oxidase subunit II